MSKQVLSEAEAFGILRAVGIKARDARLLVPIGKNESGLRPKVNNAGLNKNGTVDHGWLQINDIWKKDPDIQRIGWENRYDPVANARMAKVVLAKQGLSAWATYSPDLQPWRGKGKSPKVLASKSSGLKPMTVKLPGPEPAQAMGELDAVLALVQDKMSPSEFAQAIQGARAAADPGTEIELPGIPGSKARGKAKARQGVPKPHGGYEGTAGAIGVFKQMGLGLGLQATSEKRQNTNPYSGKGSDHEITKKNAYAVDMSNGDQPTPEMDEWVFRVARRLGMKGYKKGTPINRSVVRNGIRWQLIYRGDGPAFGGNHMNHGHLGAERVG